MTLRRLLYILISPSRARAECLLDRKVINSTSEMFLWNRNFYIFSIVVFITSIICSILDQGLHWFILLLIIYVCVTRINELILAYYQDSMSKLDDVKSKLPIGKSGRAKLLAAAYAETAVLFAIIHYCIDQMYFNMLLSCAYKLRFDDVFQALYFSVVTITTTGYGDNHPDVFISRFISIVEMAVGLFYVALVLFSYSGLPPGIVGIVNAVEKPDRGAAASENEASTDLRPRRWIV